ncbi:hypothetical protein MMAS_17220 [Mycobacteroides abscessus subsp. massiliense CCUG 48898 = JCM 15300]|nr:hypothetical protein MMAS_17220 [Mycobacteroides abscessus subsp. massiliense CCUG 48898 = JCM 15300]
MKHYAERSENSMREFWAMDGVAMVNLRDPDLRWSETVQWNFPDGSVTVYPDGELYVCAEKFAADAESIRATAAAFLSAAQYAEKVRP